MKACPYCYGDIQEETVNCEHCHKSLMNCLSDSKDKHNPNDAICCQESIDDPLDNPNRHTITELLAGDLIGNRYLIKFKLGQGGMGSVYLTMDQTLEDTRAIKVLPDKLTEDLKAVKRLKEEARITMKLKHENIVQLHNYEEKNSFHYLVMEYVNGIDLNIYTGAKGTIGEQSARRIGIEVAKALRVAHGHRPQIIHRDIKPANILLEWPGLDIWRIKQKGTSLTDVDLPDIDTANVKLTDFGIAQQIRQTLHNYGHFSDISGTKPYMSPEQIRGIGVDTRTDLYSLGATLYELLSGDPPFSGVSIEYQVLNEMPESIKGISDEMNAIIRCLLEKDKEKRCKDADELIGHLKGDIGSTSAGKKNKIRPSDGDPEPESTRPVIDAANIFGGNCYLSIKTSENCEIWIDGIDVGETKNKTIVFKDIKGGKHIIEGRTKYRRDHEELDFRPNDVKRIHLELKEVFCDLRAISDGIDYELIIDGNAYECPKLIEQLPASKNTITIKYGDFQFNEEIELLYEGINEYDLTKEKIKTIRDSRKDELISRIETAIKSNNTDEVDEWITQLLKLDSLKGEKYQNDITELRRKIKKEAARKEQDDLWQAAKDKGTKEAYEEYISRYPQGRYVKGAKAEIQAIIKLKAEEARQKAVKEEDEAWLKCQKEDKLITYEEYLNKYSRGRYVKDAEAAINAIDEQIKREKLFKEEAARQRLLKEEDDFWRATRSNGKREAYDEYGKKYPRGRYVEEAINALAEISHREEEETRQKAIKEESEAWFIYQKEKKLSLYESYLKSYPQGQYVKEAEEAVKTIKDRIKKEQLDKEEKEKQTRLKEEDEFWSVA